MPKSIFNIGAELFESAIEHLRLHLPTDPIPASWPEIIDRNVPLARRLDAARRERLMHIVQLMLQEAPVECCGDLQLTEEIEVTVAATAGLLVLALPYPRFNKLVRVLVYPDSFIPEEIPAHRGSRIERGPVVARGEAWMNGVVVLSWDAIMEQASRPEAGRNVILHEFAHMLDAEDGTLNGIPLLDDPAQLADWERTLNAAFERSHDEDFPLDSYASTNEAELFAVATEAFFATPLWVRPRLADFYAEMVKFYRRDPALEP